MAKETTVMMGGALVRRSVLWGLSLLLACWAMSECSAIVAPEDRSDKPEYCTIFTHMVKSGGTTIKDLLIEASAHHDEPIPGLRCGTSASLLEGTHGACARNIHGSSVIASAFGELLRLPLAEIGRECEFFTMVRHPIDRLVSAFFYCPTNHDLGRKPSKWCSGTKKEDTAQPLLMEYATTHWKNMALNQMILSTLCPQRYTGFCSDNQGVGRAPNDMTTPEGLDLIERAQEALASYKAVGIFEHFDLSMDLFDATVVSPVREWNTGKKSNSGRKTHLRQRLLEWAHLNTELRRFLAPDLMMYDIAVSIFQQQTRTMLGTEW